LEVVEVALVLGGMADRKAHGGRGDELAEDLPSHGVDDVVGGLQHGWPVEVELQCDGPLTVGGAVEVEVADQVAEEEDGRFCSNAVVPVELLSGVDFCQHEGSDHRGLRETGDETMGGSQSSAGDGWMHLVHSVQWWGPEGAVLSGPAGVGDQEEVRAVGARGVGHDEVLGRLHGVFGGHLGVGVLRLWWRRGRRGLVLPGGDHVLIHGCGMGWEERHSNTRENWDPGPGGRGSFRARVFGT
jgi:hypothetical protein